MNGLYEKESQPMHVKKDLKNTCDLQVLSTTKGATCSWRTSFIATFKHQFDLQNFMEIYILYFYYTKLMLFKYECEIFKSFVEKM